MMSYIRKAGLFPATSRSCLRKNREIAPTLYDTIVDACPKAGFEPMIGRVVPHAASVGDLSHGGEHVQHQPFGNTAGIRGAAAEVQDSEADALRLKEDRAVSLSE
jgi:hypothetical protein